MFPYVKTEQGLTVFLADGPRSVSKELPNYGEFVEAVRAGDSAEVSALFDAEKRRLEAAAAAITVQGTKVRIVDGQVLYGDEPVHNTLTQRMLRMLDEGFDLAPMARFLENLLQNPSHRAVRDLYSFLEHGQMPLTPDGCFMAYKAVREDFRDIHTGTMDNSPGKTVEMARNRVDENPDRTCSSGLHVCSYEYLPHFARADGHVVAVKVNPRDVVAIPRDYNDTKMRVCRYEVVQVIDYVYTDKIDYLRESSMYDVDTEADEDDYDEDLTPFSYRLVVRTLGTAPTAALLTASFDKLTLALQAMERVQLGGFDAAEYVVADLWADHPDEPSLKLASRLGTAEVQYNDELVEYCREAEERLGR